MMNAQQGADIAHWRDGLAQGCQALGLTLDESQQERLVQFMQMLLKWNKVYNLTALRSVDDVLSLHVLDSLAAVAPLTRYLQSRTGDVSHTARLLDVGSGGGLPGVVFAVCLPHLKVHCVDTVGKKAAFIQQVAATLRLPNLRGIHARVESLQDRYDVVSCRAFASLPDFTQWSTQVLAPDGVWLAMKGREPVEEIQALPAGVQVDRIEALHVPALDAERCIVWMRPVA